jgi:DNA-binding MarR family transcriptional regulator
MGTPRWLNEVEARAWRSLLTTNRLLFEQLGRDLNKAAGLSMADYEVLVRLSDTDDRRLRMSDLAAVTLSSKSRLSHQIARMEEAGWVRREACASDKRVAYAVLTEEGWDTLVATAPEHVESVRRHLFDRLTAEEVAQLAGIMGKLGTELERGMQPEDGCAAPRGGGAAVCG